MKDNKPIELIHVVEDLDEKAIAKGYYEDLANSDKQQFIGISNAKELLNGYYRTPTVDQTYVYDISSQLYFLLDDSIEKYFSESRLESYITTFGYMGATHVEGKIIELNKKERLYDTKLGVTAKTIDINLDVKSQTIEELSRTISVERNFGEKSNRSYEEIRAYLITKGLMNDIKLKNRLEELKNSSNQQLRGTYTNVISLTHNLDSILDIGFQASITPFFKGNTTLKKRCSSQTEIHFKLFVSFD